MAEVERVISGTVWTAASLAGSILAVAALFLMIACGGPSGDGAIPRQPLTALFTAGAEVRLIQPPQQPVGDAIDLVAWGDAIAVADGPQSNVKLFSRDGSLLWVYGRQGRGPGEFSRPFRLAVVDKRRLAVLDGGQRRLSFVDAESGVQRSFAAPAGRVGDIAALPGDRLLFIGELFPLGRDETQAVAAILTDSLGNELGTSGTVASPQRVYEGNLRQVNGVYLSGRALVVTNASDTVRILTLGMEDEDRIILKAGVFDPPQWPRSQFPPDVELAALAQWSNRQHWIHRVVPISESLAALMIVHPDAGEARYVIVCVEHGPVALTEPSAILLYGTPGALFLVRRDDAGEVLVARASLDPAMLRAHEHPRSDSGLHRAREKGR